MFVGEFLEALLQSGARELARFSFGFQFQLS